MEQNVGGRDRLARIALTIVFSIAAVQATRSGNKTRGLLAAVVAIGLGFNSVTCFCGLNKTLGIDTTSDD